MDDGKKRAQVIMITSSIPGEGKSTVSLNLAHSLAQLERVLLIDCDMRKPTIAKALELPKDEPGLSSLITNTADAQRAIKRGVITEGLDVITSGPMPDQPLELLSSMRTTIVSLLTVLQYKRYLMRWLSAK
jgi:Mrp family chromosome partitioning ATPase